MIVRVDLEFCRYEDVELYSQQQHWTEYTAWGGYLTSFKELYFWAKRVIPFLGLWALSNSVQGALLVVRVQSNGTVAATSVRPRVLPHGPLDAAVDFESMQVCRVVPAVRSLHSIVMAPLPKQGEKAVVLDATVRPDSMFAEETAITLLVSNEQEPLRHALRVSMLDITQGARSVLSFRRAARTTTAAICAAALIRSITDTTDSTVISVTPAVAAAAATAAMTAGATTHSEHAETGPLLQNFPEGVTGMYWAVYGPHGFELINVSWCANSGVLTGEKITGDVNVPASQATFETTGPFVAATADDTQQQQQQQQQCECMFGCECFTGTPGNTSVVYGHMEARAKTAGTGYHNPTW
jgi:Cyclin D1 binding domain